ncbi:hypothetical protein Micbo1qcDRAFT_215635 [Microdochium bolleyi]|uniref:Uncharacterized protein n=1 Tax=Microdochium bolleyi TaxID=196109 RepID=A0A136ISC5_9PEZI|nr:hypothetical protein Micbo1qcDRAFT_215635 [Microdochium bolleyi]
MGLKTGATVAEKLVPSFASDAVSVDEWLGSSRPCCPPCWIVARRVQIAYREHNPPCRPCQTEVEKARDFTFAPLSDIITKEDIPWGTKVLASVGVAGWSWAAMRPSLGESIGPPQCRDALQGLAMVIDSVLRSSLKDPVPSLANGLVHDGAAEVTQGTNGLMLRKSWEVSAEECSVETKPECLIVLSHESSMASGPEACGAPRLLRKRHESRPRGSRENAWTGLTGVVARRLSK